LQYLWTKWHLLTCSRTINSNLCDSNFSIATFPMISAAPFNGKRWRMCTILFYFTSGSNGKTQPWYWLATNNKTTKEKHGENRMPVLVAKDSILHQTIHSYLRIVAQYACYSWIAEDKHWAIWNGYQKFTFTNKNQTTIAHPKNTGNGMILTLGLSWTSQSWAIAVKCKQVLCEDCNILSM
jgi:hypothetical protein